MVNGWVITMGLGIYGTDYLKRAIVAAFGWPANRQEDAVYPYTEVDGAGENSRRQKVHADFRQGRDAAGRRFLVDHYVRDRQRLVVRSQRAEQVHRQPAQQSEIQSDGSLTLYFQNESPGKDKEANWLPAPTGDFITMLRMYWPKEQAPSILDRSWKPPSVALGNRGSPSLRAGRHSGVACTAVRKYGDRPIARIGAHLLAQLVTPEYHLSGTNGPRNRDGRRGSAGELPGG